jgi:hypothetical protein
VAGTIPPFFLTPRRFPAESEEPALKLPARFVAVRTPRGSVGLRRIWGRAVGTEGRALRKDSVGRIVIAVRTNKGLGDVWAARRDHRLKESSELLQPRVGRTRRVLPIDEMN